jgi:WD40 repeat protein
MRKLLFVTLFVAGLLALYFAGLLPNVPRNAQVAVLAEPHGALLTVAFSPDSSRAFTTSKSAARIWEAASGKQIAALEIAGALSFNRDGTRILASSPENKVRVLDVATGKDVLLLAHENRVLWAGFNPDGTRILTASGEPLGFKYKARIWDAATGAAIMVLVNRSDREFPKFGFSADGTRIFELSSHRDEPVVVWDAITGAQISSLKRLYGLEDPVKHNVTVIEQGHSRPVFSAAFSTNGAQIVTASIDEARVWTISPGIATVTGVLRGHSGLMRAAFSPDGQFIVATTDITMDAYIYTSKGVEIRVLDTQPWSVNTATFSPDGRRIVTALRNKEAKEAIIWDAGTGKRILTLSGHGDIVESAIFSPNGKLVATRSRDGSVRIWKVDA